jgi:hypothetical protein
MDTLPTGTVTFLFTDMGLSIAAKHALKRNGTP